jgi:hypothetical protein
MRPKALQWKDFRCPSEAGQRLAECPAREAGAAGVQAVARSSESTVGFVRPKRRPLAALPLASLPAPSISTTSFVAAARCAWTLHPSPPASMSQATSKYRRIRVPGQEKTSYRSRYFSLEPARQVAHPRSAARSRRIFAKCSRRRCAAAISGHSPARATPGPPPRPRWRRASARSARCSRRARARGSAKPPRRSAPR